MQATRTLAAQVALLCLCACAPRHNKSAAPLPPTSVDQHGDAASQLTPNGVTAKLRVLETTDLHVNLEAFDYYKNAPTLDSGLVRTAVLLRKSRSEVANAVTIDNGDLIQGSPLGDWFQKERNPQHDLHTAFKAMNLLGYDAANVGNHEFNYGLDFLEATLSGAKFPYVSANIRRDDGDANPDNDPTWIQPYVLLKKTITADDGTQDVITIGIIGFAPPQIMKWDRSNLTGKLNTRDIVDTAAALVPRMRAEGADVVIAVPHSGISAAPRVGNDENAVYWLAQVPGIDAILSGHSHLQFPSATYAAIPNADLAKGTIEGIPTVMAGFWGSHVGVIDLNLKKSDGHWHVLDGTGALRAIKTDVAVDEVAQDVRDAIKDDHASTLTYLQTEVGATDAPIHSYFSQIAPSSAVELINAAQLWFGRRAIANGGADTAALQGLPLLSASAPLKAGGSPTNYTDVAAGKLTLRNVADLYVYPNTVRIVKITGAQVADWLEMAAGAFNQVKPDVAEQKLVNEAFPAYNFDQLAGVEYDIDVAQAPRFDKTGKLINPDAHRIVNLRYQGQPIDQAAPFLVVTNNYRANGGGNFPGLDGSKTVFDPGLESRVALREYVESLGGIVTVKVPAAWRVVPVPAAKNVIFRTGPAAADKIAELGGLVEAAGQDPDGYARFRLKW